jgi:tRNA modification GTPase
LKIRPAGKGELAMYPLDDTIAAVASPPGGAARGIVRLSGPNARPIAERIFTPFAPFSPLTPSSPARPAESHATAIDGTLQLPNVASPLPCDLYLWPAGRSYTGQPVVELHTLGSPPLVEAALETLCAAGARLAGPGEFTLRAFLAGRIDLTQAEAVLGVIDAADASGLEAALSQLAGGLGGPLRRLRGELIDLLAHLEAELDFADEDIPRLAPDQLDRHLAAAAETISRLVEQMAARREATELIRVVLIGWPNAGKSSLFNALLGRTGALVSPAPGTTRDYLTAELELDGQTRCLLIDTAGVEPDEAVDDHLGNPSPHDPVRRAAQAAAAQQDRLAHVRVLCLDGTRPMNAGEEGLGIRDWGLGVQDSTTVPNPEYRVPNPQSLIPNPFPPLLVLTKADLPRHPGLPRGAIPTSSVTGDGLEPLKRELVAAVRAAGRGSGDVVASTAVRCGQSLRLAAESLHRARQVLADGSGEELVAAELRIALDELGQVVGAVYTEDVLDRVFSRFCVGK